jgi:hypothetical protein
VGDRADERLPVRPARLALLLASLDAQRLLDAHAGGHSLVELRPHPRTVRVRAAGRRAAPRPVVRGGAGRPGWAIGGRRHDHVGTRRRGHRVRDEPDEQHYDSSSGRLHTRTLPRRRRRRCARELRRDPRGTKLGRMGPRWRMGRRRRSARFLRIAGAVRRSWWAPHSRPPEPGLAAAHPASPRRPTPYPTNGRATPIPPTGHTTASTTYPTALHPRGGVPPADQRVCCWTCPPYVA